MSESGPRMQTVLTDIEYELLEKIATAAGSTKKDVLLNALGIVGDHIELCQQGYRRFYEKKDGSDRIRVNHKYDRLILPD